jgi:threonine/homoserine/homoserine lactone efflux protein
MTQTIRNKEKEMKDSNNKWNTYATSKSVSQNFLNTTTIASQITLMVLLFESTNGSYTGFQITLIVLIILSLLLQLIVFILLVVLAQSKKEQVTNNVTSIRLNNVVTCLTGILLIINIGISAVSSNADINTTRGNNTVT